MFELAAFRRLILEGRRRLRVPGLAGALVVDGTVVETVAVGRNVARRPEPLSVDHVFPLGSCSKLLTGTLVRWLEVEGRIDLDEPLDALLPRITRAGHPAYRGVTLRQLLHHRSGLLDVYVDDAAELAWMRALEGTPREQRAQCFARVLTYEPRFAPGSAFGYANLNYALLAHAAEARLDRPIEDLLRERIFLGIGLASAGFDWPEREVAACGHRLRPLVRGLPFQVQKPRWLQAVPRRPTCLYPSGGIHLSVRDLAGFLAHLQRAFEDRSGVLPAAVARAVHTPLGAYASGLNVEVRRGERVHWHLGRVGLHFVDDRIVVDRGWAFVVAANSRSAWQGGRAYALEILERGLAAS